MTAAAPGARRRPSIKDVAAVAGVSFQTVSKVLRGQGNVTDATRQRVHDAVDEVGYVPDDVARSLVTRRTRSIGLVVGDLSDHVVARFVTASAREARVRGHGVVVINVGSGTDDADSWASLLSRRVDGIVAAAPQFEDDPALGTLLRGTPSVAIHSVHGGGVALVGSDHLETGRLATGHLLDHGHRRAAMVTGLTSRHVTASRTRGWQDAHRRRGLEADPLQVVEGDWTPRGGHDAMRRLLAMRPELTSVFVHNDLMAVGALHALSESGRRVPDDVAVVGCDDVAVAAHVLPPLTTVALPFEATGATAVGLLLDLLDGGATPPGTTLLEAELVQRSSCGCSEEMAA